MSFILASAVIFLAAWHGSLGPAPRALDAGDELPSVARTGTNIHHSELDWVKLILS